MTSEKEMIGFEDILTLIPGGPEAIFTRTTHENRDHVHKLVKEKGLVLVKNNSGPACWLIDAARVTEAELSKLQIMSNVRMENINKNLMDNEGYKIREMTKFPRIGGKLVRFEKKSTKTVDYIFPIRNRSRDVLWYVVPVDATENIMRFMYNYVLKIYPQAEQKNICAVNDQPSTVPIENESGMKSLLLEGWTASMLNQRTEKVDTKSLQPVWISCQPDIISRACEEFAAPGRPIETIEYNQENLGPSLVRAWISSRHENLVLLEDPERDNKRILLARENLELL